MPCQPWDRWNCLRLGIEVLVYLPHTLAWHIQPSSSSFSWLHRNEGFSKDSSGSAPVRSSRAHRIAWQFKYPGSYCSIGNVRGLPLHSAVPFSRFHFVQPTINIDMHAQQDKTADVSPTPNKHLKFPIFAAPLPASRCRKDWNMLNTAAVNKPKSSKSDTKEREKVCCLSQRDEKAWWHHTCFTPKRLHSQDCQGTSPHHFVWAPVHQDPASCDALWQKGTWQKKRLSWISCFVLARAVSESPSAAARTPLEAFLKVVVNWRRKCIYIIFPLHVFLKLAMSVTPSDPESLSLCFVSLHIGVC